MKNWIEIFGWYGAVAVIVAYALISFSFLDADNIWYHLIIGSGALGIMVVSFYKKSYQPAVLNLIFTLVAVVAILRIVF